jgi:hypothetical protein
MRRVLSMLAITLIAAPAASVPARSQGWPDGRPGPPIRMPREIEHRGMTALSVPTGEKAPSETPDDAGIRPGDSALEIGARLLHDGDVARAEVLLRQASAQAAHRAGAVGLLWQLHERRGSMPIDEARVASLSKVVGPRFARYESAHVVMLSDATAQVASARMGTLERTRTEFIRWARRAGLNPAPEPSKHLCVLFAKRDGYIAFAAAEDGLDASGFGGHYAPSKERMAMYADAPGAAPSDGLTVRAMHEAAHMVAFRTGTQTRARTQPFWLSEGLASAFEPIGETVGAPDRKRDGLRERLLAEAAGAAHADGADAAMVPLESLIMRDSPPREDPDRLRSMYQMSEALVRYLARHRSEALARYMESLATGAPGRRTPTELRAEFVAHFGEPARLEREMRLRPW